nr:transcription factor bHLH113 [Ipomoea batatas]GMC89558.1 transcription factor bHLH113 [Ipomoea batatas]GMD52871.1 transcription factor bHLH113 [Ipomoea batatas]
MADDDPLGGAGSYSQLLFGDDDVVSLGTDSDGCLNFSSSSFLSSGAGNSPQMLCFGTKECRDLRSGKVTCSEGDSSSASSVTTTRNHKSNVNRKRNNGAADNKDSDQERGKAANQGNGKKNKPENPKGTTHAKGKKEKLGDRIAALQQLVSPFGKGDTASVLHEAMGYIRFLQEQVNVLCSPYLNPPPSSSQRHRHNGGEAMGSGGGNTPDMRSRGLCLVPVDLTLHVAHSNGADFWSPAAAAAAISVSQPNPPPHSTLN